MTTTSYANEPHITLLINDHTRMICTATSLFLECVDCGAITELREIRHESECTGNAPDLGGDAGIILTSDFLPFDMEQME